MTTINSVTQAQVHALPATRAAQGTQPQHGTARAQAAHGPAKSHAPAGAIDGDGDHGIEPGGGHGGTGGTGGTSGTSGTGQHINIKG